MASRYSREREPKELHLKKNQKYKRKEIIEGLDHPADYIGISHYITRDGKEIYTFFIKDNFNNKWKPPIFTYEFSEACEPDNKKYNGQTRHVFYNGEEDKDSVYEYLGTTKNNERLENGKVTWEIE